MSLLLLVALGTVGIFATGEVSYAITHGISMLPAFHTGDLVIMRAAGSYHVGEIVAYRSPLLHTVVLHRIVAEHNGLFSFKGDHNTWLDPQKLTAASIVGTLWLHIPRGGIYVSWFQSRTHQLLIALIVVGLVALLKRKGIHSLATGRRSSKPQGAPGGPVGNWPLGLGAVGLLIFGALAALSFSTAPTRSSLIASPFTEHLDFSYSGRAAPSAVYPTGSISTGQPIFTKLAHSFVVRATYRLVASRSVSVSGTVTFNAALVGPDGWTRSLITPHTKEFVGPTATAAISLPIAPTVALINNAAKETGVDEGGETIIVTAKVSIDGTMAAQHFTDTISAPLSFQMSPLEFDLVGSSPTSSVPASQQLTASNAGTVDRPGSAPASFALIRHHLGVATARRVSVVGVVLASLLLLIGLFLALVGREMSEEERIRRRIRHELVSIASNPSSSDRVVIELSSLNALVELSERAEVPLLDYLEDDHHTYFAEIGDVFYRYSAPANETPGPINETPDPADSNVVLLARTSLRVYEEQPGEDAEGIEDDASAPATTVAHDDAPNIVVDKTVAHEAVVIAHPTLKLHVSREPIWEPDGSDLDIGPAVPARVDLVDPFDRDARAL